MTERHAAGRPALETAELESGWAPTVLRQAAQRGDGAVVLVTGEAGIRKTAFMQAVAEDALRRGFAVGIGKAEEIGQIAPGAPLLIALRSGAVPRSPRTSSAASPRCTASRCICRIPLHPFVPRTRSAV
jgi:hypothetical protein